VCIYVLQNASKGFYQEANENTRRRAHSASTKAPLLSFATSITTIAGRRKNRDGRIRAKREMMPPPFTRKTTDKTNRYVDVNIIRDLLLIQPRYPVGMALDPGQLNIRFEILFDRLHS